MAKKIVVVGAGFAGVWSALAAKRLINLANKNNEIEVLVIAPEPHLVIRPRLYEANPASMAHPFGPLFEAAGIQFFQGTTRSIQTEAHTVRARSTAGIDSTISYDRLILAAGSSVARPKSVTGLEQHAFDVDTLASAAKLEAHLQDIASQQASPSRRTVVVCGGGFTGIELAAELPKRLQGRITDPRVILIDSADVLGPELGPGPRPTIMKALKDLGVEVKLGSAVVAVDTESVTLASGERIETATAVWTVGVRATSLTQYIPGPKDALSRLQVDVNLRVPSCSDVFATGDAACALADTENHHALMSCQHANQLGRFSGHNAAADLLGEPLMDYSQAGYICCLDMGAWGAVISGGWEREVKLTGDLGKKVKCMINQKLIYPPDLADEALSAAYPDIGYSDNLLEKVLSLVQ